MTAFSLSPAWVCVLCMDMHAHMKESDVKSLSTIAGILFQHRNKQKDTFLQCVTQTLSSRLLASCCGRCVRTAMVPVPPWGGLGELGKQTERVQGPVQGLQLRRCLVPWRQQGCPGPKHPLGAPAGSPAPQEQDLALMASTICHKSQGRRTQRTELLFPWQRGS